MSAAPPAWQHRYPPLLTFVFAVALAVFVLPTSLRVHQPRTRPTLSYAPVPAPEAEPALDGATADLATIGPVAGRGGDAAPTTTTPPPPPTGVGVNPSTKRCVGTPPRQTEDPLAPPCVAYFDGDNFGETYPGVTAEEIRLVLYYDGFVADTPCSSGTCTRPSSVIYDLFEPEDPDDDPNSGSKHLFVRAGRVWQRYFNDRFQTYGRTVHFYVAFGPDSQPPSPAERRADAAEIYDTVRPFAVISNAGANADALLQALAQQGVLNFGALFARPDAFYHRFPALIWGYRPSIERQAEQYASYVCQKAKAHPAVLNGDTDGDLASDAGDPRRFGVIHTSDPDFPNLIELAGSVRSQLDACGVEITATATFPSCCYAKDNSITHEYANTQMADFQQRGITTILYLGGIEGYYGPAAQAIGYQPEWIVLGDGQLDGNNPPRLATYSDAWHGRAILVTPEVFHPPLRQQLCYQAFREVDREMPNADLAIACPDYRNLFQLFSAVQVAGPRLTPSSIDTGFHAIPPVRSEDPKVPACFYLQMDFTCVKDAQAELWDRNGVASGDSNIGCWRSIERGRRHLTGEWPPGNIDAQLTGDEPCNAYNAKVLIQPA